VSEVEDRRDPVDDFERALQTWAERSPRLSPQQAATRVKEGALRRRRRAHTRRTLLATAALLAVALTFGIRRHRGLPEPAPPPTMAEPEPAPLGAGQALIWLDAETPLYMTFEAPPAPQGEEP
jgi:hypothetical protein